jgi:hypothetical protein
MFGVWVTNSTYLYMAPEILLANGGFIRATPKSDIYSYAVSIWELFAGCRVWPDLSHVDHLKQRVQEGKLPPFSHLRQELQNLLYLCWLRDPDQRPNAEGVRDELYKIILSDAEFVKAVPTTFARQFWFELTHMVYWSPFLSGMPLLLLSLLLLLIYSCVCVCVCVCVRAIERFGCMDYFLRSLLPKLPDAASWSMRGL